MILVTGAAGKTGRAVVRALVAEGRSVRALVHREEQVETVEALGAADVRVGDMRSAEVLREAMVGARAVYHICPNVHPEEVEIGRTAIEAGRAAGVRHFVFHSVLHPQIEAMPHHWKKLRVEEALLSSGLPFTILQPAAYMQNVLAHEDVIREEGVYPIPYAPETRIAVVDLEDVAAVAALVTGNTEHADATYELCGPGALSQTEVARVLGERLGRPVEARAVSRSRWRAEARERGVDERRIEVLVAMFRYYERHGLAGNPRVLESLLGRPPTSFSGFVDRGLVGRAG